MDIRHIGDSVSAIAVLDLIDELVVRNLLKLEELAKHSLDLYLRYQQNVHTDQDALPIQEQRIQERHFIWLWQVLDSASSTEQSIHHALAIGATIKPQATGLLAHWISQCGSLQEALATFLENIRLMNPSEQWQVSEVGGKFVIEMGFKAGKGYPYIALLRSAAALLSWVRFLSGEPVSPVRMVAPKRFQQYLAQLESHFDCEVSGEGERLCLYFDRQVLKLPVRSSNPYLKNLLGQQAKNLSKTLSTDHSVRSQVEALLNQDLPAYANIQGCSDAMNMSRTTLFRRLRQENTTFSELLGQARREKYRALKAKVPSNQELSEALGFSDTSAYYKFIRKARG